VTIGDCGHVIRLEFFLGNKLARRRSLAKINLLIEVLRGFRDALAKEITMIEKGK
jgi:hypothetical protein